MSKATPGPWYVGEDSAADCPDHANSGLALVDTGREYDWPIARLVEWNNAHLIAAAPELLAALKSAEEWMSCVEPHLRDGQPFKRDREIIRAVLAKAEGK